MNKRYFLCAILVGSLSLNNQVFMQQQESTDYSRYVMYAAAGYISLCVGLGRYIGCKNHATSQKNILADTPPHFQQWARDILVKNNLPDADTIPLKIGDRWEVTDDSFIQAARDDVETIEDILTGKSAYTLAEQKRILDISEFLLLHEKKHYSEGDGIKHVLLKDMISGAIILGPALITSSPFLVIGGIALERVINKYGELPFVSMYVRHQEKDADLYALAHMDSEKIANVVIWHKVCAQYLEKDLLNGKSVDEKSDEWLKLAKKLRKINGKIARSDGNLQELLKKKESIIERANYVRDRDHPSCLERARYTQEELDKRKANMTYQGS